MLVIVLVLFGFDPFRYLQTPTPGVWTWLLNNKIYGCMLTFFLCGLVETQLISTGAFEIFLNKEQLWSKIETGRVPDINELFNLIDVRRNTLFQESANSLDMASLRNSI